MEGYGVSEVASELGMWYAHVWQLCIKLKLGKRVNGHLRLSMNDVLEIRAHLENRAQIRAQKHALLAEVERGRAERREARRLRKLESSNKMPAQIEIKNPIPFALMQVLAGWFASHPHVDRKQIIGRIEAGELSVEDVLRS